MVINAHFLLEDDTWEFEFSRSTDCDALRLIAAVLKCQGCMNCKLLFQQMKMKAMHDSIITMKLRIQTA